jgi:hypothetical protein
VITAPNPDHAEREANSIERFATSIADSVADALSVCPSSA